MRVALTQQLGHGVCFMKRCQWLWAFMYNIGKLLNRR